jgi:hypothetical protein
MVISITMLSRTSRDMEVTAAQTSQVTASGDGHSQKLGSQARTGPGT